jgi:hypothetical protein
VDALEASPGGVASFHGRTGAVVPVSGDYTASDVGAAAASHTHAESDVTGLVSDLAALDGRLDALEAGVAGGATQAAHAVLAGPTTGSPATPTFRALVAGDVPTLAQSQVTNLVSDLAGKAATSHTHAQADVTGLVSDLAGKAASVHTHAASDVTSGVFAIARLATGTPDGTKFVRDDGTLATPSGGASFPAATAAGQAPVSTGAGTTYTAQDIATQAELDAVTVRVNTAETELRLASASDIAALGAHTTWRLTITAAQSQTLTQLSAIELRSAVGGANAALGATITASNTAAGAPVTNLLDGNNATSWNSNPGSLPVTVQIVTPTPITVSQLALRADSGQATYSPSTFTLEYIDAFGAWQTAITVPASLGWAIGETRTFSPTASTATLRQTVTAQGTRLTAAENMLGTATTSPHGLHAAWRTVVEAINVPSQSIDFLELQFRPSPGGTAHSTIGATMTASSINGGAWSADKAFDGSNLTGWISAGPASGGEQWIAAAFPSPVAVGQIAYTPTNDSRWPTIVRVEYSDNSGASWTTAWRSTGLTAGTSPALKTLSDPAYGTAVTLAARVATLESATPGASALTVKDEGSTLTSAATSFDFVGAGVTATNTGGAVTVTVPGATGGGTTLYTRWDVLIPDTSPHTLTDEFTSSASLSNYTAIYTGDAGVTVNIDTSATGKLYVEAPSVAYKFRTLLRALPAGDFTIHTRVAAQTFTTADAAFAGIVLSDSATAGAGSQTCAVLGRGVSASNLLSCGRVTWGKFGLDGTSAVFDTSTLFDAAGCIRLRRVGSTYYMAFSIDGEAWFERTITLLGGITPGYFGLMVQNFAGQSSPPSPPRVAPPTPSPAASAARCAPSSCGRARRT